MGSKVRQAVIMVGGEGTRLRPLTYHRPKAVLPVLDKPCLRYLIESMAAAGIEEVILACGFDPSKLSGPLGDGSDLGIVIEYSREERPLGTAGAIKQIEDRLDETFLAANGDVFADVLIKEQIEMHTSSNAAVTIAITPVEKEKTKEFGIARLAGDGRIIEFIEKPEPGKAPSDLANAGIYVVNRSVLADVPPGMFNDFSKDLMPILLKRGDRIQGFRLKGTWRDVGRPSDLLGANLQMAAKLSKDPAGGAADSTVIKKPFFMGTGASITDSEAGSAVVMEGCIVKKSKINKSVIMRGCEIDSARIENSIIGEGCRIHGAHIANAVLGDGTVVGECKEQEDK
ncbi:MAG: NDP-sugar synthase [Methanomassiliicoccaceae archaeon]|nr:NDP-sugar synthase [Methanomassiliicoccaceae archaeon]